MPGPVGNGVRVLGQAREDAGGSSACGLGTGQDPTLPRACASASCGYIAVPEGPGASSVLRLSQGAGDEQCKGAVTQVSQPPVRGVSLCPCAASSRQAEQVSVLVGSCPVTTPLALGEQGEDGRANVPAGAESDKQVALDRVNTA